MTGYGKASIVFRDKKITAEIRSLNSKLLDLTTRIAPLYREKEMEIRAMISETLERGKVEFCLWIEREETAQAANIDGTLAASYYKQILEISKTRDIPTPTEPWQLLLRMPDVINKQEMQEELSAEEWDVARSAIKSAIGQLMDFRRQEGAALENKFREKVDNIETLLQSIEPYEKARTLKIRQRLEDALSAIPEVDYDRGRLEQEMIFYIEKLDINEEKQRLSNHLNYLRTTLDGPHG